MWEETVHMTSIWLYGNGDCRLPQGHSGPGSAMFLAWLYLAGLPEIKLMPPRGVKEIETAFSGCNLTAKDDKQDRSPPGGAVCV